MIRARLLVVVGCWATFSTLGSGVQAAPLLGADRPVDAPLFAPAPLDQQTPAIAFGAGKYLVVWRDGDKSVGQVWAVRGVRLAADGTVLDDPPLAISDAGELLTNPVVGFDGQNFLVAWEWPDPAKGNASARGAYVDPSTGVVGKPFLVVAGLAGAQTQPALAGGDGYLLCAVTDNVATDANATVRATLLGQGMTIQADFPVSTQQSPSTDPSYAFAPSVAWAGPPTNRFVVAWEHGSNTAQSIVAATIDIAGTVSAPVSVSPNVSCTNGTQCTSGSCNTGVGTCTCSGDGDCAPGTCAGTVCQLHAGDQAVASDGNQFLAVWSDGRAAANRPTVYGRAISFAGAPSGSDFQVAHGPAGGAGLQRPQLVSVGGQLITVYEQVDVSGNSLLGGARFTGAGVSMDPAGVVLTTAAASPAALLPADGDSRRTAIATDGTRALASWWLQSSGADADDIYLLPADPSSFTASPSILATRDANYERARSIASNGSVFLVVWEDDRNLSQTGLDVYGLRVGADGKPIDAAPFLVSAQPGMPAVGATGNQMAPVAAGLTGGDFLVVWADDRNLGTGASAGMEPGLDLYGAHVPASGAPVALAQPVSNHLFAQLSPTVAASADGWLVVWEDWRIVATAPGDTQVFSALVPKLDAGAVPAEHPLTFPNNKLPSACAPSVVWDGQGFFVAYEQPCSTVTTALASQVSGQWLNPDASPTGVTVAVSSGSGADSAPSVTSDGAGKVFLAWRNQGSKDTLLGAAVSHGAAVLAAPASPLFTDSSSNTRESPSMVWTPGAPGTLTVSFVQSVPAAAQALRFRADGSFAAIDAAPWTLDDGPMVRVAAGSVNPDAAGRFAIGVQRSTPPAALAALPTGQALAALDLTASAQKPLSRLHLRALGVLPPGVTCTDAGGCADGICTGGACCNTSCDGVCQACGTNGCVDAPATDGRCAALGPSTVSCATLSTSCRSFADVAGANDVCVGFGECAVPGDPARCVVFTDEPDGTACTAAGCTRMGACAGGACVCPGQALPPFVPRTAPNGCACGLAGGPPPPPGPLLLLGAALAFRLRHARRRVGRRSP